MNRDVSLRDATRALRAVSGESHAADPTRLRVLGTVTRRKRARRQLVAVAAVVFLGLPFGTTAYAAFFGTPAFVQAWLAHLAPTVATAPAATSVATSRTARAAHVSAAPGIDPPVTAHATDVPSAQVVPAPVPGADSTAALTPTAEPAAAHVAAPRMVASTGSRDRRTRARATSAVEVPGATPVDDASALYARAHELHFVVRDPESALAAWDAYLAHAPSAALAPEAKYNRALCLVRLHRNQEALHALAPFAEGAHGNYRRREAVSLISALTFAAAR